MLNEMMDREEHTLHDWSVGSSRTGSQIDGDRNFVGEKDQQGKNFWVMFLY